MSSSASVPLLRAAASEEYCIAGTFNTHHTGGECKITCRSSIAWSGYSHSMPLSREDGLTYCLIKVLNKGDAGLLTNRCLK